MSEKITRPQTAEVGQVLAVKEIDESGKPTVFEAEDVKVPTKTSELENDSGFLTEHQDISGKLDKEKLPEAIDDALAQAKESGEFDGKPGPKGDPGETTYIENPYDDTEIKKEIAAKITAPENPEVGKVFKIKSVNDDGTFIGEWADANLDVQINGQSIVKDGVAEIPIASPGKPGVLGIPGGTYGLDKDPTNNIRLIGLTNGEVDKRFYAKPLTGNTLDYAVKAAMCDGKGAAWTAEEQTAARDRIGIGEWELFADIALEEKAQKISFTIENWKELFVRIDAKAVQDTVSTTILYPFNNVTFCDFYPETGKDASIYVHMVKFDDYAFYEMSFNSKYGNPGIPKLSIVKRAHNSLNFARDYFESGTTAKVWIMR